MAQEPDPKELLGKRIFNTDRYMGLGVIVDVKTLTSPRNGDELAFVCDHGKHIDGSVDHDRFITRPADNIYTALEHGSEAYDIGEIFDGASPDHYAVDRFQEDGE